MKMSDPRKTPTEDEIARMLETFRPVPGVRFHHRMQNVPWRPPKRRSLGSRIGARRTLAVIAAAFIVLLAAVSLFPGARATALKLFRYFQSAPADQQHVMVTPPGTTGSNIFTSKEYFSLTIDGAESQASFQVLAPEQLPGGFNFTGARYDSDLDAVSQLYSRDEAIVLITQRKLGTVDETGSIGASADVQQVMVRGFQGEYVHGGWRTLTSTLSPFDQAYPDVPVDLGMEWDAQLNQAILRWEENGFGFQIVASGIEELNFDMMLSFAEGLNE